METEPLERTDEHQSGETPEDVAILYSWANLQGAKYRDFSANRREYRAQMRHRAAEQLRLMELRAQSEAEAAATHAEAEAAAAHAEADAATVKLAVSRSMPSLAPDEIIKEKEVEEVRRASLREAAQQARRAAAERLEAARRAESAALADSIARREEREIAEAQASALRQAAQYHESEVRSRQMMAQHPDSEDHVPGQISDPYSPQILPEGEYYDGPGTPPSELEASRFRTQREYIERSTGTELPPFKMPPLFNEDRLETRPAPGSSQHDGEMPAAPRRVPQMHADVRSAEEREFLAGRNSREPIESSSMAEERRWQQQQTLRDALSRDRRAVAPASLHGTPEPLQPRRAEVVSRIPDEYDNPQRRAPVHRETGREQWRDERFDGSLLNEPVRRPAEQRPVEQRPVEQRQAEERVPYTAYKARSDGEWRSGSQDDGQASRGDAPASIRQSQREAAWSAEQHRAEDHQPQLYSATPRPSGSWLRQISARDAEAQYRRDADAARLPVQENGTGRNAERTPERGAGHNMERRAERISDRPSVEATYDDGQQSESSIQADEQPSGFRPPWLTQAQAPRPSRSRQVQERAAEPERPTPRWLSPEQTETPKPVTVQPVTAQPVAIQAAATPKTSPAFRPANAHGGDSGNTLQAAQENVPSRWFALKGVFAQTQTPQAAERHVRGEKDPVPMLVVYSLAGGVGKTSLVATLGRTLSALGEKVLLTDTTSPGLLPFYFGANELASSVVRTFSPPSGSTDAAVHMVNYDLGQRALDGQAQAGLVDDLLTGSQQVNRVLIDLNGSCGWLVERIARLKPAVLVPVTADMNSVVSLQTVEKRFAAIESADGEPLRPFYLLNQFDPSLPLHIDLREVLRQQLGDRLLPFVIRRAPKISEALAEGMTIVDYDPDSPAAQDFLGLANWVRAVSALVPAGAAAGLRNLRWSER